MGYARKFKIKDPIMVHLSGGKISFASCLKISVKVEFKAATGSDWQPTGGAPAKKQDKKKEKKEAPKVEE